MPLEQARMDYLNLMSKGVEDDGGQSNTLPMAETTGFRSYRVCSNIEMECSLNGHGCTSKRCYGAVFPE